MQLVLVVSLLLGSFHVWQQNGASLERIDQFRLGLDKILQSGHSFFLRQHPSANWNELAMNLGLNLPLLVVFLESSVLLDVLRHFSEIVVDVEEV